MFILWTFSGRKAIEGNICKKNKSAPYAPKSHDLLYLAKKAELELTEKHENLLDIITGFNMNARYDNYEKDFYLKCTSEYTSEQLKNIEEVVKWLKSQLTTN